MIQVNLDFTDEQFRSVLREEIQRAVADVVSKEQYPPILTRDDLKNIFQVESASVSRMVAIESFPKFSHINSRYPRDQVMEWIKENSTWVEQNSNYFRNKAM